VCGNRIRKRNICTVHLDMSPSSVVEPHRFYAAPAPDPAPGKNFDAAPDRAAPAPAPTLLYSKENFLKRTKF
jgi:hypothetical protein